MCPVGGRWPHAHRPLGSVTFRLGLERRAASYTGASEIQKQHLLFTLRVCSPLARCPTLQTGLCLEQPSAGDRAGDEVPWWRLAGSPKGNRRVMVGQQELLSSERAWDEGKDAESGNGPLVSKAI